MIISKLLNDNVVISEGNHQLFIKNEKENQWQLNMKK